MSFKVTFSCQNLLKVQKQSFAQPLITHALTLLSLAHSLSSCVGVIFFLLVLNSSHLRQGGTATAGTEVSSQYENMFSHPL